MGILLAPGALFMMVAGAIILRSVVATYNKLRGQQNDFSSHAEPATPPTTHPHDVLPANAAATPVRETGNPYQAPYSQDARIGASTTTAVPDPTFVRALRISAARVLAFFAIMMMLGNFIWHPLQAEDSPVGLSSWLLPLGIWFAVGVLILGFVLPTSLKHALLIQLGEFLIYLLILGMLLVILFIGTI